MNIFIVFARVTYGNGSTSFNPEAVYDSQEAALDCANKIFSDFEGHLGVTVIEAQLNEVGAKPIYIRDAQCQP